MSQNKVAHRSIITPQCVLNRGGGGAFDEAVRRLREEYQECYLGWTDKANYHLVLEIEPIEPPKEPAPPQTLAERLRSLRKFHEESAKADLVIGGPENKEERP